MVPRTPASVALSCCALNRRQSQIGPQRPLQVAKDGAEHEEQLDLSRSRPLRANDTQRSVRRITLNKQLKAPQSASFVVYHSTRSKKTKPSCMDTRAAEEEAASQADGRGLLLDIELVIPPVSSHGSIGLIAHATLVLAGHPWHFRFVFSHPLSLVLHFAWSSASLGPEDRSYSPRHAFIGEDVSQPTTWLWRWLPSRITAQSNR
jgi:hypothetical protein